MRLISKIVLLIAATGILFSCATNQSLKQMVPQDTVIYVEAANPDTLLENIDDFISPLGFGLFLGGNSLKESLFSFIQMEYPAISEEVFDFTKPAALAMVAGETDLLEDMNFFPVIYLPLKNTAKSSEIMKSHFDEGTYKLAGGYFIISQEKEFPLTFPIENSADLSALSNYSSDGITMFVDFKKLLGKIDLDKQLKKIKADIARSDVDTIPESQLELSFSVLQGLFDIGKQLETYTTEFIADKKGISTSSSIGFIDGESISNFMKDAAPLASSEPMVDRLKYIPENYLFSMAFNVNPTTFEPMFKDLMAFIGEIYKTEDFNLTQKELDEYTDYMAQAAGVFSGGMTMALDYNINILPYISGTGANEELIDFNGIGVFDITDSEKYRSIMEKSQNLSFMKKLYESTANSTGIKMDFKYEKDLTYKSISYDRFAFDITVDESQIPEFESEETMKMYLETMTSVMNKMTMNMAFKDKKLYLVMGDNSLDTLVKLVETDSIDGRTLADTEILEDMRKKMPKSTISFGHFSVARLGQIIINNLEGSAITADDMPTENAPGMVGYSVINNNKLDSYSYWFMDELQNIIMKFFGLFPAIMSQVQI